tara:strand:+ start:204 stop:335 length:132 start_codon:yes stop_codon:yes gene_type:complete
MIKKIALSIVLLGLIVSCGKKDDPTYKETQKQSGMQNILIKVV